MSLQNIIIGSCCILLSSLLFATNDAIVKLSNLKILQLMIGRFTIQFMIAILWWNIKKPNNARHFYGDEPYIKNIWIRGVTYSIIIVCEWYGIIRLPMGDAYCIFELSPIVQAIMAAIFLKETLPKTTPITIIVSIFGVTLLVQPTFLVAIIYGEDEEFEPLNIDGLIAMFIAVLARSITTLLNRTAKEAHFIQLEIAAAGQTIFTSVPIILLLNQFVIKNDKIGDFDPITWNFDVKSIIIMIAIGIIGFSGLSLNVIGFQYGEATKVSWLEYMSLLFIFLYQIFIFNNIPNIFEIIGATLVVITCFISLFEEFYKHYFNQSKYSQVPHTDYDTNDHQAEYSEPNAI